MQATTTPPPPHRRVPRWLVWPALAVAGLAGLLLILLVGARLLIASEWGRDLVERQVESRSFAGQTVRLDGFEGDLLGAAQVAELTVADKAGVWLRIEAASLDWSPLGLLGGTLRIDTLTFDRIDVVRRPELPARQNQAPPSGQPGLPDGRLVLGRFHIETLDLGAPVLGTTEPVRLRVEAEGRASLARGDLEAAVIPLSGQGDRLEADLAWAPGTPLIGQVRAEGPAGGLFSRIARLDPEQSLGATFEGRLSGSGWDADATVSLDGAPALTFTGSQDATALRLTGQVRASAHPLGRPVANRLGGPLDVVFERDASRQALRLAAPNLTAEVDAAAAPLVPRTANVTLTTSQVDSLIGADALSADSVAYRGRFERQPDGAVDLSGTLEASGLSVTNLAADGLSGPLTVGYDPEAGQVDGRLSLSATGLQAPGAAGGLLGATPTVSGRVAFDLADRLLRLDEAVLRTPALNLTASGATAAGMAAPAFSGRVSLDGRTAALAPLQLDTGWEIRGNTLARPRLILDGTLFDYPDLPAPLARLAAPETGFGLALDLIEDGGLEVSRLRAESGSVRIAGGASLTGDGRLRLSLDGDSAGVEASGVRTGPLAVRIRADGTLDDLSGRAILRAPDLEAQGINVTDPVVSLTARRAAGALEGDLSFEARSEAGPVSLVAAYGLDGADWSISEARLDGPSIQGRADLSGSGGDPGRIGGAFSLRGEAPGIPALERIEAEGRLTAERIELAADANLVLPGRATSARLDLTASGTPDALEIGLKAQGETTLSGAAQPVRLDLKATGAGLTGPTRTINVSGDAALGELTINFTEPLKLSQTQDGWAGDGRFDLAGGRADLTLAPEADGPRLTAKIAEARLAPILTLAGQPSLAGTLSGEADLSASGYGLADLQGTARLSLEGLQRPGNADDPPVDLELDAQLGNDRLEADVAARDRTGLAMAVEASAPIDRSDGGRPRLDGPLTYRATGGGPVDSMLGLALPPNIDAGGRLKIDVTGRWPAEGTGLEGRVELADGHVEHGDAGFRLEALAAELRLQPAQIELVGLSAQDGAGGDLSGEGTYVLSGGGNTLALSARSLRLADRRDVSATASGDVRLEETASGFSLAGELTLDRADIDLDALPGAGLTTLDVKFAEPGETGSGETDTRTRLALDLSLKAPRRVFVRGQGLDAELAVSADITGPAGNPRIDGRAEIVRGRFDLAGKRFEFRDSLVRFDGNPMDAVLDIQAVRETDTLTAIVDITGTPLRPQIALRSEPDVPEDEVLSRVLFGRSPAQLSALETARLAGALAQLAGGGGLNLTGGLEDALGLDALDFGRTASGASELTTGKYLAENVYLEVRTGAEGDPGIALEWLPRRNIEVEADLKPAEGQELSIRWTRDFD